MEEAIKNFPKQFEWVPQIQNVERLEQKEILVAAGMGGSALPAELLQALDPALDIVVHRDYKLSGIPESVLKNSLVAAISYSGNTEETLSAFDEAISRKIPVVAISVGGNLLERARQSSVPYIQIQNTDIQPRMATGFMVRALAALAGRTDILKQTAVLASSLNVPEAEKRGKEIAEKLKGKIPLVYASEKNYAIAHNWKITFNETGKIPAFFNVFPELNHNEMTGFGGSAASKKFSGYFYCVVLRDAEDDARIQKRMEILEKLYKEKGVETMNIQLAGESAPEKIFSSLLVADFSALHTALFYKNEPSLVPMVEEFKKLMYTEI